MNIEIKKYNSERDYYKVVSIIKAEGEEWKDYLKSNYKDALENSISFVAFCDGVLCGYSRSISDNDIYLWIIDLLVDEKYRGYSIGKMLMESVLNLSPNKEVYVMSDVDAYYEKLGYKNEGSIFRVG